MSMEFTRNKEPISENELQRKISELPSELQAEFLKATDMLIQRESEIFLEMIKESRNEINGILQGLRTDSSGVRTNTGRTVLERFNDKNVNSSKIASNKLLEFVEKREKTKKISKINYAFEKDHEAVDNYLKAVGRHKESENGNVPVKTVPSYARPASSGPKEIRPGTAYKLRLDESHPYKYSESTENEISNSVISIKNNFSNDKEDELINKLKEQDTQATTERDRQIKLIEKRKAERQNKTTASAGGVAASLMNQSRGVDEKQLQNKLNQEKAIQERLEKVRGAKVFNPMEERSSTIIEIHTNERNRNSLFEESINELSIRPRTGDSKSPIKTPEIIRLQTPTKSGWSDSGSSRDISALFEVSEQYPQSNVEEKPHRSKKHKKKKESVEKKLDDNKSVEFITIED